MAKYYRTKTGLFYKEMSNGKKVRVSKEEYLKKAKVSNLRKKKVSRKRTRSRRGRGSRGKRLSRKDCQRKLSKKIRKNTEEYNLGKFQSRQQALAVSYGQVNRKYPECLKYFRR